MEMLLFMGIQASGKTSFYRERFFDIHLRISLDLLRTCHRKTHSCNCAVPPVKGLFLTILMTPREGRPYIEAARQAQFRVIGYFFEPDPQASFERNQQREKRHFVPAVGLFGTLKGQTGQI